MTATSSKQLSSLSPPPAAASNVLPTALPHALPAVPLPSASTKKWMRRAAQNDAAAPIFRYADMVGEWADAPSAPPTATFEPMLYAMDLDVAFTAEAVFEQAWHDLRATRPISATQSDDDFAHILTPFIMECVHACAHPAKGGGSIPLITLNLPLFDAHLRDRLTIGPTKDVALILAVTGADVVIETVMRTTRRLSREHDLFRSLRQQALIIRHLERLMHCAELPESDHQALLSFYAQFDEDMDAYLRLVGQTDRLVNGGHRTRPRKSLFRRPLAAFYKSYRTAARILGTDEGPTRPPVVL